MKDRLTSTLVKRRVKVPEVAEALGYNHDTVRRHARLGLIPGARKVGRDWSFDPDRINAMLAKPR